MPSLWKFGGLTPWNLGKLLYKKIGKDELSTRSASLSYYFLLAVFPMFLFLLSLGAVIILMAWLYITGFAILIGAEVNWIIENEDKRKETFETKMEYLQQQMKAG